MVKLFEVSGLTYWTFKGTPDPVLEAAAIRLGKEMADAGLWGIELKVKGATSGEGTDAGANGPAGHF